MKKDYLSTDSYKGVRDFYPEEMAVQQYIFSSWSKTAERFGFERYDASILEPSELYKSKGAENEEMVHEQTYTFIDRGDREVTLRPEMTPTVARMIAAKRRELAFPARWYSIPNLFRYERPQKGRLREHWQLNCDIFGADDYTADVEIIALAYQMLIDFGATPEMFEIRINDRALMDTLYDAIGLPKDSVEAITKLNDRRRKISNSEYRDALNTITNNLTLTEKILIMLDKSDEQTDVVTGLSELGIKNVLFDKSLARGFDYYTGTIFEIFERDNDGKSVGRAMLGGGRYDNLTGLFAKEAVSGIGFGMGDVTMHDFLTSRKLIPDNTRNNAPTLLVIPTDVEYNLAAQKIAHQFRQASIAAAADIGTKKMQKKVSDAAKKGASYILVVGADEVNSKSYTLKTLATSSTTSGSIADLIPVLH